MTPANFQQLSNFIWSVADLLRGPYRPPQYERVMLPLTVLRRFDWVLEPTKDAVLKKHVELDAKNTELKKRKKEPISIDPVLNNLAKDENGKPLGFHNHSRLDFRKLKGDPDNIGRHLTHYINGFSENIRKIFERFEFDKEIENIPLKHDIVSYVQREVRPYVKDAWIDRTTLDEQDGGGGTADHGAVAGGDGVKALISEIKEMILSARRAAVHSVDLIQVVTNFEIGCRIVEHEQQGEERAEYGEATLKELSEALTSEFGKGFSKRNLEYMRQFYLNYRDRRIAQTVSAQLEQKGRTLSGQLKKSETLYRKSGSIEKMQTASAKFTLSWSHYVFLMSIKEAGERSFYEIEATDQGWSLRELKRQFNAGLYERPALSRDKNGLRKLAAQGQIVTRPEDLLKEPYVLEFLGLGEKARYSESNLESAIIDKLEHFLLELGKGFLFEARQKRFTFDEDHFFVDLVFYNRLLHCYVLIDLKIGKLTHAELGQMQMYVNYFDRFVKLEDEQPTIGIVLCKKKHDALVEITLPKGANIHAREYKLYLPDKELLRRKLEEWSAEVEGLREVRK